VPGGVNEKHQEGWPPCPHCGHKLCSLDRLFDDCVGCGGPLPTELKLDFHLKPVKP
jgi:hypothetical protein